MKDELRRLLAGAGLVVAAVAAVAAGQVAAAAWRDINLGLQLAAADRLLRKWDDALPATVVAAVLLIFWLELAAAIRVRSRVATRAAAAGVAFAVSARAIVAAASPEPSEGLVVGAALAIAAVAMALAPALRAALRAAGEASQIGLVAGALTCALWGVGHLWVALQPTRAAPSLLWIAVPNLRADHVHALGYTRETTPNLDRLASGAWVSERTYAASPVTLLSLMSALHSLSPRLFERRLAESGNGLLEMPSIADLLRGAGYRTAIWASEDTVRRLPGFATVTLVEPAEQGAMGRTPPWLERVRSDVTEWLAAARAPALAVLVAPDLQLPLAAEPYPGSVTYAGPMYAHAGESDWRAAHAVLTDGDRRFLVDVYDGALRRWDQALGQLLEGLNRDVVVVVSGVNGITLGDGGALVQHDADLGDANLRVPLVIATPGGPVGVDRDHAISAMDIAPTILQLLGLPPYRGFAGRAVPPYVVAGAAAPDSRIAFAEVLHPGVWRRVAVSGSRRLERDMLSGRESFVDLPARAGPIRGAGAAAGDRDMLQGIVRWNDGHDLMDTWSWPGR